MSICVPRRKWGDLETPGPNYIYEQTTDTCYERAGECNDCDDTLSPIEITDCNACGDNDPDIDFTQGTGSLFTGTTFPAQQLRFKIIIPKEKTFLFQGRSFTVYAITDRDAGNAAIGNHGFTNAGAAPEIPGTAARVTQGTGPGTVTQYHGFTFTPKVLSNGFAPTLINGGSMLIGAQGCFTRNITRNLTNKTSVAGLGGAQAEHDDGPVFEEINGSSVHAGGSHVVYTSTVQTPTNVKWAIGFKGNAWNCINQPHLGGGISTWAWSHFWAPTQTAFASLGGTTGQSAYLKDGPSDAGFIDNCGPIRAQVAGGGNGVITLNDGTSTLGATATQGNFGRGTNFQFPDPKMTDGDPGVTQNYGIGAGQGSTSWQLRDLIGEVHYNDNDNTACALQGVGGGGPCVDGHPTYGLTSNNRIEEIDLSRPPLGTNFTADLESGMYDYTPGAPGTFAAGTLANIQPNGAQGGQMGMATMAIQNWGRSLGIQVIVQLVDVTTPARNGNFIALQPSGTATGNATQPFGTGV